MQTRRALTVALAGAALAATFGAAWGLTHTSRSRADEADAGTAKSRYFDGYFTPKDSFPLAYATIGSGDYHLGYHMTVQFTASDRRTVLKCGFIDPNGVIGYLAKSRREEVYATGTATRIAFNAPFQLPEITVELQCTPSAAGRMTAQFGGIEMDVTQ
jgi:hypothetical protein